MSLSHGFSPLFRLTACVVSSALLASASLHAQSVIGSNPTENLMPAALRQQPPAAAATSVAVSRLTSPFQQGNLIFRPYVSYRYLYGDGLQARPGQQRETAINSITPGLIADLGTKWTVDYAPTWTYYSNDAFRDTVDHSARLTGATAYDEWNLGLTQSFSQTTEPLVETGTQTEQASYAINFQAAYRLGEKTQIDNTLGYSQRDAENYPDSRTWTMETGLHYRLEEAVDAALALQLGSTDVSTGSDMTFMQPQLKLTWEPAEKTSLRMMVGYESRKIHTGNAGSLGNAIGSLSFSYEPFDFTRISVEAGRSVNPSLISNQVSKNNQWSIGADQRFFGHFYLNLRYSHGTADYVATDSAFALGRGDTRNSFNARLSTTFLQRGTIALIYNESRNSTNIAGFGYKSSQAGFEVGFRY